MPTGLIIADDHPLVRSGIRKILAGHEGFTILAETRNPDMVADLVVRHRAGLLIMDVELSGQDTTEIVRAIRAKKVPCGILIFSRFNDMGAAVRLHQAGINGFISKTADCDVLLEAMTAVAGGGSYYSPEAASRIKAAAQRRKTRGVQPAELTRQEINILRQVTDGSTNSEIALKLFITERTVEFHMRNVLQKLGAKRRLEAVVKARAMGLV